MRLYKQIAVLAVTPMKPSKPLSNTIPASSLRPSVEALGFVLQLMGTQSGIRLPILVVASGPKLQIEAKGWRQMSKCKYSIDLLQILGTQLCNVNN